MAAVAERLASHGFVVAAPDHVGNTLWEAVAGEGLPLDTDLVIDCRFLPNPHWVEDLRPLTGLDEPVRDYVLGQPLTGQFLAQVDDLLRALVVEGKKQKPALEVRRDLPVFVVAEPEVHRDALVKRLHERVRSLAGDAAGVQLKVGPAGRLAGVKGLQRGHPVDDIRPNPHGDPVTWPLPTMAGDAKRIPIREHRRGNGRLAEHPAPAACQQQPGQPRMGG
jgi:hypothetical protein